MKERIKTEWVRVWDELAAEDDESVQELDFESAFVGLAMGLGMKYVDAMDFYHQEMIPGGKF